MFAQTVDFGPTIRLVPHSGIQFVNYQFNVESVGRLPRNFIERELDPTVWTDGRRTYRLIPAWDENDLTRKKDEFLQDGDRSYAIDEARALETFLGKWVPIPMFRVKAGNNGPDALDAGPTNWVRARVTELPDHSSQSVASHRVVFAFDTELADRRDPNRPYTAPTREDSESEHAFRFVFRFREISWFLGATTEESVDQRQLGVQEWVRAWLQELFEEFRKAKQTPGRPLKPADNALEYYARYLVLLEYLEKAVSPRTVKLVDTVSKTPAIKPVQVDLVLDIGNSRTCGILMESHPNDTHVDLNKSFVLQLRDLSSPEMVYNEPFDSHVELSQAHFGNANLSKLSTRTRAFVWPSPVRTGPEAARFREMAQGNEAVSGLSSPKRYLCDTRAVNQEWRFPARDYGEDGNPPPMDLALRAHVNCKGDVLEQLNFDSKRYGSPIRADDKIRATRLTFSRSSFFTFMVAEIVCQTLSMINDVAVRERRATKDAPRRLRRIILTLPSAMPIQEQRILRSRAEGAIVLIWKLMNWWDNPPPNVTPPKVHVAWDEASCVQFVYLYGELTQKLGGSLKGFFDLVGRERAFAEPDAEPGPKKSSPEPSLRIASVDVGGGTTDLMITTYYEVGGSAIKPVQNFREGFRIAGDDILKVVIERLVLPPIEEELKKAGVAHPRTFISERFGGDRANMAEQDKHLRRQFVIRVLEPIALRMLADAEAAVDDGNSEPIRRAFTEFFATPESTQDGRPSLPPARLIDFIDETARTHGAKDFELAKCTFASDLGVVRSAVSTVLTDVFALLSEAIYEFDCDIVLLSGRPSRLPAVVSLFVDQLAVTPDRVIPMHAYQAGTWYPFRGSDNRRIGDPKTTTVVGGMLCALAENELENLHLFTGGLGLRSTARIVGAMEINGRLKDERICFTNMEFDSRRGPKDQSREIAYFAPMRLGYRQLPLERWIASPLYNLRVRAGLDSNSLRKPFTIMIERSGEPPEADGTSDVLLRSEAMKEEIRVISAVAANHVDVSDKIELILDTLANELGYWRDTGILSIG